MRHSEPPFCRSPKNLLQIGFSLSASSPSVKILPLPAVAELIRCWRLPPLKANLLLHLNLTPRPHIQHMIQTAAFLFHGHLRITFKKRRSKKVMRFSCLYLLRKCFGYLSSESFNVNIRADDRMLSIEFTQRPVLRIFLFFLFPILEES